MCGLIGCISKGSLSVAEKNMMEDLFTVSQRRGMDSTGMCVISAGVAKDNKDFKFSVDKSPVDSTAYINSKEWDREFFSKVGVRGVIGHTRAATIGAVNMINAHPFKVKNIIGVHNGSIRQLAPMKAEEDYRTDSLKLYEMIQEHGIKGAIRSLKSPGAYDCAYALVWVDTDDNTLHFLRNTHRPLWYMSNKMDTTLFWASEPLMLGFARRSAKYETLTPVELKPNVHITYQLEDLSTFETEEISPYVTSTVVGFTGSGDKRRRTTPVVAKKAEVKKEPTPLAIVDARASEERKVGKEDISDADVLPWKSDGPEKHAVVQACGPHSKGVLSKARIVESKHMDRIPASEVFNNLKKTQAYPPHTVIDGVNYTLRYEGWRNYVFKVKDVRAALNRGCALTGIKAGTTAEVYWLGPTRYVHGSVKNDGEVIYTSSLMYPGTLVYMQDDDFKKAYDPTRLRAKG